MKTINYELRPIVPKLFLKWAKYNNVSDAEACRMLGLSPSVMHSWRSLGVKPCADSVDRMLEVMK
jgi:predicted transcriptional regulator